MVIGITGSIASGKSTVTRYLREQGYQIIDSDEIVHKLYEEDNVIKKIASSFSSEILENGKVDRKKLGQIIFNNKDKRLILNSIIHPLVIKKIKEKTSSYKGKLENIIFVDIPLLYEENLEHLVDKVIVIYLNQTKQIKRLMARDSIDEEYAIKKIKASMNLEVKKAKADYVIDNSFDLSNTYKETDEVLRRIKNEN
ncbi:MAG: dephospho-CoA kinase [Bacilli bacterium]|nr:dephospho-CoA kinase [Bacilli bacterium]